MSNTVISVENLSKAYRLGQIGTGTFTNDLKLWWAKARGKPNPLLKIGERDDGNHDGETIWALKDVSFTVEQGEVLGIIGRNGAGKSTLLKILSRVTAPTSGKIKVKGRVASLLEVGTGFHPDLTGRENVYLNGSILGMNRREIDRKFDEIVDFAEVDKFIDTPVKRYSSGMYVRLAFAVAAHLEVEILLVDEVLAVGDAAFQKKCLGKMEDVAHEGRTVLFVSHNLVALESLCECAIWLSNGKIVETGKPAQIISSYLQDSFSASPERNWPTPNHAFDTESVRLHRISVRPLDGAYEDPVTVSTPFRFEIEYWNFDPKAYLSVGICLYNEQDVLVFDICPPFEEDWRRRPSPTGLLKSECQMPGYWLNDGLYRLAVSISRNQQLIIEQSDALIFAIRDSDEQRYGWYDEWPGVLRPLLNWKTNLFVAELPSSGDKNESINVSYKRILEP